MIDLAKGEVDKLKGENEALSMLEDLAGGFEGRFGGEALK